MNIKCSTNFILEQKNKKQDNNLYITKYVLGENSTVEFCEALQKKEVQWKISNLLQNLKNTIDVCDIDECVSSFNKIVIEATDHSVKTIKPKRSKMSKKRNKNNKKWFTEECILMRKKST